MRLNPLLGAILLVVPSAPAPARPAPAPDLDATLARAVAFCEATVTREAGKGLPVPVGQGVTVHDGAPPAMGVPDIVKRFAATQPSGRIASSPPFYIHLAASDGQVWAVVYETLPMCDLMVTDASGDMPAGATALATALSKRGWRVVKATAASDAMPLAQQILLKTVPKPGAADSTLRLLIGALAPAAAGRDGVQMHLSLIAGTA